MEIEETGGRLIGKRESSTECSCSIVASVGQTKSCGQGLLLLEEGILVLLQLCVHT